MTNCYISRQLMEAVVSSVRQWLSVVFCFKASWLLDRQGRRVLHSYRQTAKPWRSEDEVPKQVAQKWKIHSSSPPSTLMGSQVKCRSPQDKKTIFCWTTEAAGDKTTEEQRPDSPRRLNASTPTTKLHLTFHQHRGRTRWLDSSVLGEHFFF